MRINEKKTKCMVVGGKGERINIRMNNEQIEQVNSFKYLGSIVTDDIRSTKEIKTRIAIAKEAFNKKKNLLNGPLNKELRKRLAKCYIWSVALYGVETWTLRKEDEKRIEAFEMWMWRRMEGVKWEDGMTKY